MLLTGLVVLLAFELITYWITPEQERLADQYGISKKNVVVEPRPHGCDFADAPLGDKHCHYEKDVEVQRMCPAPNCRVTSVYVTWRRVEE